MQREIQWHISASFFVLDTILTECYSATICNKVKQIMHYWWEGSISTSDDLGQNKKYVGFIEYEKMLFRVGLQQMSQKEMPLKLKLLLLSCNRL